MIHVLLEFYLTFHHTMINFDSNEFITPIISTSVIGIYYIK